MLFAAMRWRCVNDVSMMIVRPYPGKVFANLAPIYNQATLQKKLQSMANNLNLVQINDNAVFGMLTSVEMVSYTDGRQA